MTKDEILACLEERVHEARMRREAASERFNRAATISNCESTELTEAGDAYVKALAELTEALKARHDFVLKGDLPGAVLTSAAAN